MKTAILVTRDPEYRRRLAALLEIHLEFSYCIEAGSLIKACQQSKSDLLLVDLTVPDTDDDLHWGGLRFCQPTTPLAVLFDGQINKPLRLAFAAGAIGFIPRDVSNEILTERLNDVMREIRVVPDIDFFERLQAIQINTQSGPQSSSPANVNSLFEQLTRRERDILTLLAEGASSKEIAARLQISEKTVRNRVSEIIDKLGLYNWTRAGIWAREQGLKSLSESSKQNRDIVP